MDLSRKDVSSDTIAAFDLSTTHAAEIKRSVGSIKRSCRCSREALEGEHTPLALVALAEAASSSHLNLDFLTDLPWEFEVGPIACWLVL